jgi:transposase
MRFVPIKNLEQQDLQSIHRARDLAIKTRTAYANQIRGLLSEYGVVLPVGIKNIKAKLSGILEDAENELTFLIRGLINKLCEQFKNIDRIITEYDNQLLQWANSNDNCKRLMRLPGVGPTISTAVVAAVGSAQEFKKGREMAAWMGLTPKHQASGNKKIMLGISKRGNNYLRKLIVHGSRSVAKVCKTKTDKRNQWIMNKIEMRGYNKGTIALANKMVREMWAILHKGNDFVFSW